MVSKLFSKKYKQNSDLFNLIDNESPEECKDKINDFIYFFIKYIEDIAENKILDFNYKREVEKLLETNKNCLLLYLNLALDVFDNQNIDEQVLLTEDFSYIVDLKGNLDINTFEGKKTIIKQIRNAFAHKSGKLIFFVEDGVEMVQIDNKGWFSIKASIECINNMFEKLRIIDKNNMVQSSLLSSFQHIKNSEYECVSEYANILLFLNLVMCYNKESVFDTYMPVQTSYIDASKFNINTTSAWDNYNDKVNKYFFNKYNVIFNSKDDEISYQSEWGSAVSFKEVSNAINKNYVYNIENLPFDIYTKKHIPFPIFFNCLRNAICHGRILIENDKFVFYDQQKDSSRYFYMEIAKQDLINFLNNDYFTESILTNIEHHQLKYTQKFYLLEEAEAANSINTYINGFRNRLFDLTEYEILKYMYDNNKFSSYLMEFPEQTEKFLEYKLSDGTFLLDLLASFESISQNDLLVKIENYDDIMNFKKNCLYRGIKLYFEFVNSSHQSLADNSKKVNISFFEVCYSFMRNLRTFDKNITFNNLEELPENERIVIKRGGQELMEEFLENDVFVELYSEDIRLMLETGMQLIPGKEIDKIILACSTMKKDRKEDLEAKEKRHTIKNIEKSYTISNVIGKAVQKNLKISSKHKNLLLKVLALNIGVRLFNYGFSFFELKYSLLPASLSLIVYCTSAFIANNAILLTFLNIKKEQKNIEKYENAVDKYLDEMAGDESYEFGNNGSNNVRKQ